MKLNRQTKSWLLIALIHAGVIYAFSRVDAIELPRTMVTATVVTSEQQAATDGVQSPSEVDKATDTQTTMTQKILARTSVNDTLKLSHLPRSMFKKRGVKVSHC